MNRQLGLCMLLCLLCELGHANPISIDINSARDRSTYMLDLLKLAISYSTKNYTINETPERLSKAAEREATKSGELSLFWGATSVDEEQTYIPVRIDAYRGLMSLRFFIIRTDKQPVFSAVQSLEQLQALTLGQGCSWNDTKILTSAGFKVECTSKKESLFHMLEGGRFDAFPRGATEAWVEVDAHKDIDLMVEQNLVVQYPLPAYFFVSKEYPELAAEIENGLNSALEDGNFDAFFYSNERVAAFLDNANLNNRTVIKIKNPFLPSNDNNLNFDNKALTVPELMEGMRKYKLSLSANGID